MTFFTFSRGKRSSKNPQAYKKELIFASESVLDEEEADLVFKRAICSREITSILELTSTRASDRVDDQKPRIPIKLNPVWRGSDRNQILSK